MSYPPVMQCPVICPHCGAVHTGASLMVRRADHPDTARPVDGSLLLCETCGGLAKFMFGPIGSAARLLTAAEQAAADANAQLAVVRGALAWVQARRAGGL